MARRLDTISFALVAIVVTACGDDAAPSGDTDPSTSGPEPVTTTSSTTDPPPDPTTSGGSTEDDAADDTGTSTGGVELTRIEQILQALTIAMYECPDRTWPGTAASYRSSQVLLVSESEAIAYLWNDQAALADMPAVREIPYAELDPQWHSLFNVGSFDGALTLGISLDGTQEINDSIEKNGGEQWRDFAISLTFHEGFHFLSGQSTWDVGFGSRSIPYPEPWEPRYYRAMFATSFADHLPLSGNVDLGASAYWRGRFTAEYPADAQSIRPYDVTEGTAEFGSAMMNAIVELGCDADPLALSDAIAAHLPEFAPITHFAGGREPYDLGTLAGALLYGADVAGWQAQAQVGISPHQFLVGNTAAVPQADDPAMQTGAQAAAEKRTIAAAMEIEPLIERMADPSLYRVVLSIGWVAGSFSLGGFYHLADVPGQPPLMLSYKALHETPSGVFVDVTGLTSFYNIPHPCTGIGTPIIVTVPIADVTENAMLYSSTDPVVSFTDMPAYETTDAEGLPWLCPASAAPPPRPEPAIGIARDDDGRPHIVTLPR